MFSQAASSDPELPPCLNGALNKLRLSVKLLQMNIAGIICGMWSNTGTISVRLKMFCFSGGFLTVIFHVQFRQEE
jgi:hypothetical protein